jgi:hypothetical protein
MHVVAHYQIADQAGFRARMEEPFPGRPPHWRLICAAPTRDGSACFCLWWADSAEALRGFLQRAVGDTSTVRCHDVDEANAMGLESALATTFRLSLCR